MSDFVDQSLLMKETNSDTYMLFPLIKNEHEQVVLDTEDEKADKLFSVLNEKLENEPDVKNIDFEKLNVEEINDTKALLDEFFKKLYQIDFSHLLSDQLEACFPGANIDLSTEYIHYGLFSYQNILTYLRYLILGLDTLETEDDFLYPYSFMSLQKQEENEIIKIKENPQSVWKSTEYYFITNVCKSHKTDKKGICSHMMNILTESDYAEKPLFLFVNMNNPAAIQCYTKNQFQKVEDVFSGRPDRPVGIKMMSETDMYMCYNKNALKMSFTNNQGNLTEYELMPVGSYRITLIAHGAVDLDPTAIFQSGFDINKHYKQYSFPFRNMQYYTKLGAGVSLMEGIDEQSAIYDVCYDNIVSTYKDEPVNKMISTIPLLFHGFKEDDPESRRNFIGLYDCNMKRRIKENYELFGENNKKYIHMNNLFQIIFAYCNEKGISTEKVEIKIFACRGFCPVGEYAPLAITGGDNHDELAIESIQDYESVDREGLFNYLRKEMEACPLPKKQGGKKKRKATRQHKKKSTKNKTRKHKK